MLRVGVGGAECGRAGAMVSQLSSSWRSVWFASYLFCTVSCDASLRELAAALFEFIHLQARLTFRVAFSLLVEYLIMWLCVLELMEDFWWDSKAELMRRNCESLAQIIGQGSSTRTGYLVEPRYQHYRRRNRLAQYNIWSKKLFGEWFFAREVRDLSTCLDFAVSLFHLRNLGAKLRIFGYCFWYFRSLPISFQHMYFDPTSSWFAWPPNFGLLLFDLYCSHFFGFDRRTALKIRIHYLRNEFGKNVVTGCYMLVTCCKCRMPEHFCVR